MNMLRDMITGNDLELVRAKLTDIDETINDTAVDVFIYDTSKDSDGGAWRHRTQHTSWYAEASSATRDVNTRSTRAEFPAVAVIVAESNKVTIYDGDDPSLPMWMVFETGGSTYLVNSPLTSLGGLNGVLCVGGLHVYRVDFVSDCALRYLGGRLDKSEGPVSQRNSSVYNTIDNSISLVSNTVNDVAMTVLPDAPTDPATGLPIPTIAVATYGGVSVITDSGAVYDSSYTGVWRSVSISDDTMYAASPTTGSMYIFYDIGSISADGFSGVAYNRSTIPAMSEYYFGGTEGRNAGNAFKGDTAGITLLADDPTAQAKGMVAYTTSDYNTGWMPGDIKLAALADTTAETFGDAVSGATVSDPNLDGVYDGEHVTNGGFATSSDWTIDGGSTGWSITGGVLQGSSATGNVLQDITTVVGKKYVISFEVSGHSGTGDVYVRPDIDAGTGDYVEGDGLYSGGFTATSTTTTLLIRGRPSQPFSGNIDNVSVRLADPDRSVNGKGLAVHGSITKAPVATGADVVGYSGFSSSNYLEQPYNSDLNFGTGDFCYSWWMNAAAISAYDGVLSRGENILEIIYGAGETLSVRVGSGTQINSSVLPTNTWNHFAVTRVNGVVSTYINGGLDNSNSVDGTNSVDTTDPLLVGTTVRDLTRGLDGSLALLRISGTAPTADQIRKIYEDEKVLFQPNAKATLTGSSDTVTALAHDPDTNLLHVGTSGGRSVFQGLRRVEEHTGTNSQSLAAISAVDGLVVEGK